MPLEENRASERLKIALSVMPLVQTINVVEKAMQYRIAHAYLYKIQTVIE